MTPDAYTIRELFIEVGDEHEIYVQEWGNPAVKTPILFVHGGPGSGCNDRHRARFDPKIHRVIFFDQRGCGRSIPYGSLKHNTTDDLVHDISIIADKCDAKTFILYGGSWGSTLALAYGIAHPKRVESMILQGIFTGTETEINHLDNGVFRTYFPDAWDAYVAATPKAHRANPSAYHFARILGDDDVAARESGLAYSTLEGSIMSIDTRFSSASPEDVADFDPSSIRIETHYMHNRCFMPDEFILNNAGKLTMPIWLVQGRFDMVCPGITAYKLDKKLPNSTLVWTMSGHANDRSTYDVLRTILLQHR